MKIGCGCDFRHALLPGFVEQRADFFGIRNAAQCRLWLADVPCPCMGPQMQIGDAIVTPEFKGDFTKAITLIANLRGLDPSMREIESEREYDTNTHHHASVGDGVHRGAGRQPCRQCEQ